MVKLMWRWHTGVDAGPRRVWRIDWASDQFEVLSRQEFEALELLAQRFSIPLEQAQDD